MNSARDTAEAVGFPIRKSSDQSLLSNSPKLIAACHVLHRLLVPRHPPNALSSLFLRLLTPYLEDPSKVVLSAQPFCFFSGVSQESKCKIAFYWLEIYEHIQLSKSQKLSVPKDARFFKGFNSLKAE